MPSRILTAALDAAAEPAAHLHRVPTDVATALGVGSLPWWLDVVERSYQHGMKLGAVALLVTRLAIALREWRQGSQGKAEGCKAEG